MMWGTPETNSLEKRVKILEKIVGDLIFEGNFELESKACDIPWCREGYLEDGGECDHCTAGYVLRLKRFDSPPGD